MKHLSLVPFNLQDLEPLLRLVNLSKYECLSNNAYKPVYKAFDQSYNPKVIRLLKLKDQNEYPALSEYYRKINQIPGTAKVEVKIMANKFTKVALLIRDYYENDISLHQKYIQPTNWLLLFFTQQILRIIKNHHDADIIHGHIIPRNIFITSDFQIVIADHSYIYLDHLGLTDFDHLSMYEQVFMPIESKLASFRLKTLSSDLYSTGASILYMFLQSDLPSVRYEGGTLEYDQEKLKISYKNEFPLIEPVLNALLTKEISKRKILFFDHPSYQFCELLYKPIGNSIAFVANSDTIIENKQLYKKITAFPDSNLRRMGINLLLSSLYNPGTIRSKFYLVYLIRRISLRLAKGNESDISYLTEYILPCLTKCLINPPCVNYAIFSTLGDIFLATPISTSDAQRVYSFLNLHDLDFRVFAFIEKVLLHYNIFGQPFLFKAIAMNLSPRLEFQGTLSLFLRNIHIPKSGLNVSVYQQLWEALKPVVLFLQAGQDSIHKSKLAVRVSYLAVSMISSKTSIPKAIVLDWVNDVTKFYWTNKTLYALFDLYKTANKRGYLNHVPQSIIEKARLSLDQSYLVTKVSALKMLNLPLSSISDESDVFTNTTEQPQFIQKGKEMRMPFIIEYGDAFDGVVKFEYLRENVLAVISSDTVQLIKYGEQGFETINLNRKVKSPLIIDSTIASKGLSGYQCIKIDDRCRVSSEVYVTMDKVFTDVEVCYSETAVGYSKGQLLPIDMKTGIISDPVDTIDYKLTPFKKILTWKGGPLVAVLVKINEDTDQITIYDIRSRLPLKRHFLPSTGKPSPLGSHGTLAHITGKEVVLYLNLNFDDPIKLSSEWDAIVSHGTDIYLVGKNGCDMVFGHFDPLTKDVTQVLFPKDITIIGGAVDPVSGMIALLSSANTFTFLKPLFS